AHTSAARVQEQTWPQDPVARFVQERGERSADCVVPAFRLHGGREGQTCARRAAALSDHTNCAMVRGWPLQGVRRACRHAQRGTPARTAVPLDSLPGQPCGVRGEQVTVREHDSDALLPRVVYPNSADNPIGLKTRYNAPISSRCGGGKAMVPHLFFYQVT